MRKRLRDLEITKYFYHSPGENNVITDVPGVKVGHTTLVEGENIRTGVTVVVPGDLTEGKFVAGGHVFNANGEVTGLHYIFEEARLISPIFLTNTLAIGNVFNAVVDYYKPNIALPVIGECWDGYLNDIWGRHVIAEHVIQAIEKAADGPIHQGSVGAGTGMTSFGFKAGIGSASRKIAVGGKDYVVGVLVNNNMGNEDGRHRYFRVGGLDVAQILGEYDEKIDQPKQETHQSSSILVIATNIPLTHYQLNRISKHATLGFARIGLVSYSGSGDFVIAFSTANRLPKWGSGVNFSLNTIEESLLDNVFEAVEETVEEAYLNSLFCAEDMVGYQGHKIKALPVDLLLSKISK